MSRSNNRRPQPGQMPGETIALFAVLGLVVVVLLVVYLAARIGHRIAGLPPVPGDPWAVLFGVLQGSVAWPTASTVAAVLLLLLAAAAAALVGFLVARRRSRASRVDDTARYLGRGRDVADLTRKGATATAQRLGVDGGPGVPIGRVVATGTPLYGSWEDTHIDVWGPRTGKTTSRAIPAILEAPGAVLVTSNKRDVVDATRGPRTAAGPVWVFDPQGVAGEQGDWWWNPLSYVTDEVRAAKLAEHFAAGSRDPGARTDAFFDPAAQDLLAGLLLAAALDRRPITDVYRWLTRPTDDEPMRILQAADGYELTADQVAGVIFAPEKQRGGVYGTAAQMAACLTNRQVTQWVTSTGHRHREFSPEAFVRDGGTLYSLSREGRGTAGPLVTALTVAVVEAAEELATASPGGRLPRPLLAVLDEAANVCRWRELPNLYSHYGSRGIVLMTILQSWSQGVDVWGEAGMRKLWSASNVAVYGGGVRERDFLEMLSALIGDYDKQVSSVSRTTRGGRTRSEQLTRDRILDVADLQALPKGRAVVLASGARPTLITTEPWMSGPHADAVRASIAAHDPGAQGTLDAAARDLVQVSRTLTASERAQDRP